MYNISREDYKFIAVLLGKKKAGIEDEKDILGFNLFRVSWLQCK